MPKLFIVWVVFLPFLLISTDQAAVMYRGRTYTCKPLSVKVNILCTWRAWPSEDEKWRWWWQKRKMWESNIRTHLSNYNIWNIQVQVNILSNVQSCWMQFVDSLSIKFCSVSGCNGLFTYYSSTCCYILCGFTVCIVKKCHTIGISPLDWHSNTSFIYPLGYSVSKYKWVLFTEWSHP